MEVFVCTELEKKRLRRFPESVSYTHLGQLIGNRYAALCLKLPSQAAVADVQRVCNVLYLDFCLIILLKIKLYLGRYAVDHLSIRLVRAAAPIVIKPHQPGHKCGLCPVKAVRDRHMFHRRIKRVCAAAAQLGVELHGLIPVSYTHLSGSPGWTIYLLNDDAFYTSSVRNINILMYLIIIIYLILVLFMSAYFSKLHYTPIRTLTESLGGSANPIKTNEFTFLQNSINTLVYKNNAYIRKNIQNEKINNLKRFILGKETEVPSALSELNSENDINSLWCVAMLKITHTSAEKLKELGYRCV